MNIEWNAQEYQKSFNFVYNYGESVLSLLDDVPKNSLIADLGCGNGILTQKIKQKGYRVIGVDASGDMLKLARENNPDIEFYQADICDFHLSNKVDAIFSNAVLHWIDENKQQNMLYNIANNLVQGGKFVFEFGGYGCGESIHATLEQLFKEHEMIYPRVLYFPTIGIYAPMLEKAGFKVEFATLFDRFTALQGEHGLADWIRMFVKKPFENVDEVLADEIIAETENRLRDKLFVENTWYADYVRIRMKTTKL